MPSEIMISIDPKVIFIAVRIILLGNIGDTTLP
jgi:hypothetical protein